MGKNALPTCGFIGLGSQGAPIARRMIKAGYPILLWGRREQTLEPFRNTPAIFARSIEALGDQADHVGLCVLDDGPVLEVCDRLIPVMRPGTRIAIHSTTHPKTSRAVAQQAAARQIAVIDAPVSGGAPAAEAGTLTLMVGGSQDVLADARPIFETFGRLIVHLGDVGSGQIAKIINNSLMAANLALAHSAVSAGTELGLDPKALGDLLNESSGRSFALEVYTRTSRPGAFTHSQDLLNKVRLMGSLLGQSHPAFTPIREVAIPFLEQYGGAS
jgi:3-hydroxyisobutyrate dehydrogenase